MNSYRVLCKMYQYMLSPADNDDFFPFLWKNTTGIEENVYMKHKVVYVVKLNYLNK